jgi:hypothetical protein
MFTGFEKIVEERIRKAQQKGEFENLEGAGEPLVFEQDHNVPEDLRLAYKILKNADCIPPELTLKKEIRQTEDLLEQMTDTTEKYRALKKLNFLVMKLNSLRNGSIVFDVPQRYMGQVTDRLAPNQEDGGGK